MILEIMIVDNQKEYHRCGYYCNAVCYKDFSPKTNPGVFSYLVI